MAILHRIERREHESDPDLLFFCPGCQCGHAVWVSSPNRLTGASWGWNGSMEKPTFTPSLRIQFEAWNPPVTPENMDQYRASPWPQTKVAKICHVIVTDGKLHFCGDSTHKLAGQVVDMVDF